jgi:hypothetical protein
MRLHVHQQSPVIRELIFPFAAKKSDSAVAANLNVHRERVFSPGHGVA